MRLPQANRVIEALFLCAVLLFAAIPERAASHQDAHAASDDAVVLEEAVAQRSAVEAPGHCHPGLDCFTAAVFLLSPEITPPAFATMPEYLTRLNRPDDVRLDMALPPPRLPL